MNSTVMGKEVMGLLLISIYIHRDTTDPDENWDSTAI